MSYFRELPNVLYPSTLGEKISSQEYLVVKNLFRRVKFQDSVEARGTYYKKYVILEGQRPDTVAEAFYGEPDLDWVVVLTAGITNIKDEWPLSNYDLYRYADGKYGTELNATHHTETLEVRDSKNRLILPAGEIVDSSFRIPAPLDTNITYSIVGAYENTTHTGSGDLNPTTSVSNFAYEVEENEKKREINLLKPIYLQQFLNETRDIMKYNTNSLYITSSLIATENSRLTGP